jgi:hypothetical protein
VGKWWQSALVAIRQKANHDWVTQSMHLVAARAMPHFADDRNW